MSSGSSVQIQHDIICYVMSLESVSRILLCFIYYVHSLDFENNLYLNESIFASLTWTKLFFIPVFISS